MANKEFQARVKHKRDTSANWTSNNPVLLDGEIILVDTAEGELRAKIGDGTKTYTQLPFSDEALRSLIDTKVANAKVTIDDTLSVSGQAADSKATGDAINEVSALVGDTSVSDQIATAIEPKLNTADTAWTQIYDSGEITEAVNAFSDIDVAGYKRLKVAINCVCTAETTTSTGAAIVFTCENGNDYVFANVLNNMIRNSAATTAGTADFLVMDTHLVCENAYRTLTAVDMLSNEEGSGADNLAACGGGAFIKCTSPISTMMVTNSNQSDSVYYYAGSRVMVWGCKV